jgi:hypothetical protein
MSSPFAGVSDAWTLIPTTSGGFAAMSARARADKLAAYDATTILEAASTVLADIESDRFDVIAARLPARDRHTIVQWRQRTNADGLKAAPTPVHPLALLAATTLALGQSRPGARSDAIRDEVAARLTEVGLRFNTDIVEGPDRGPDSALALSSRSALWRVIEQEDWMIWSGDLVDSFAVAPEAKPVVDAFRQQAGLSIEEWWYRGLGERATRAAHGARSWGGAEVDSRVDAAWRALSITKLDEAVTVAREALTRARRTDPVEVSDPFDLGWLATRPVVETLDGRRFQLWLGANNRSLLPAAIAQTVADVTHTRYDAVAELLGHAAERLLNVELDALPSIAGELRFAESTMPATRSKCDYLYDIEHTLVGIEFTMITPTRALTAGSTDAVERLITRIAAKVAQIYSSFDWRDPEHGKRWLPLVVFASPTVVDPLLNERVHERLIADGVVAPNAASEVMTCHAPELLDLVEHGRSTGRSVAALVQEWRDGPRRGSLLDWWLSDHGALRGSGRKRIRRIGERAEALLAKPES